ncbi:ceramide phosphoethanolamine synthase-like [Argopecten irradians]|uniref:ceramide phosphoethanolamine synthase-like n=1 Tax=Argopecten irradians TaxID=31199 RepID=UPI0037128B3F
MKELQHIQREAPSRMISYLFQSVRSERNLMMMASVMILMYFFFMDIILYASLQNTNLLDQKRDGPYSPFHPLSIKLIMTDPANHYIINPTTEYFDQITQFSKIFYFITPNVISTFHLFLGLLAAKFVSSESLRHRRIGVVIYEIRSWLDGYDGVVYRSQSGKFLYKSNRHTFGYMVDSVCDTTAGIALCFGCLFYLWKCPPTTKTTTIPEVLPWTKPIESNIPSSGEKSNSGKPSKNNMFFKVLCFGLMLALASLTWDRTVESYASVLQKKLDTTQQTELQTQVLHSTGTWVIVWIWRLCEGQAMLQMILIAIFIDKIWEFLNLIQYSGFIILGALNIFSEIHIRNAKLIIGL